MSKHENLKLIEEHRLFGGRQQRYSHYSSALKCDMTLSIYLPPQAEKNTPLPLLYWLSGLTCNDENFTIKSGAQRVAAELGLILVIPDTSPRGENVANDADYDLGQGAGFYLNATQAPWAEHFQMGNYISRELPALLAVNFNLNGKQSISGHSMGGHGALIQALSQPGKYSSVSAFAPIVNPSQVPWGAKAFSNYLGDDQTLWQQYDSCYLLSQSEHPLPVLIDQGSADTFLNQQLQPEKFAEIAQAKNWPIEIRIQEGYDHSYYFIASFIEDHLLFHAKHLG